MSIIINFYMLKKTFSTSKIFIRNNNLPICLHCIHFIENTNNYMYNKHPSNKKYDRFNKFGKINITNGLIEYDFAKDCRNDIKKCGINGLQYKNKDKK